MHKINSARSPQNRFVAPDFKRRQLIFDSFTKLKQRREQNGHRSSSGLPGPKGTLLYTWGAGYHGQLGLSSYRKKCKLVPAYIEFKEPVVQVACGGFHTAVLTDSGRVYTWGDGRMGQLGNLARKHNMHATPHVVDRLATYDVNVVQISCGQYHTAAVSSKGDLYSWGSGKYGQLGHATRLDQRYPYRVDVDMSIGPFYQVSCGDRHTAAVTRSRKVVTFGSGQHGQLGHGNGYDFLKPKAVEALAQEQIKEVTAGSTCTCAITESGVLYLWGFGESIHPRELTNIVDTPRVVRMKNGERVKQVACGQSHIIILTETGDVYAFGNGLMGQIGHGSKTNVRHPRLILKGKEVFEVGAGRYHSMAVTAYGVLYSWGCGESGQLAHNSLENEYFPRIVEAILPNVVGQIACGEHHSFCLSSIEHASVSQDVLSWKMIEDEELKLKKTMLKELVNGLKTRHILQVEQERQRIIRELNEDLQKEKQDQARHLEEQLESINGREELLREVQQATDSEAKNELLALIRDETALVPVDSNNSRSNKKGAAASQLAVPSGATGLNVSMNMRKSLNTKSLAALRAGVAAPTVNKLTGEPLGDSLVVAAHTGPVVHKQKQLGRPMSSPSLWHKRAAGAGADEAVNLAVTDPLHTFQPLVPRMNFIEKTTSTLARVKKFLQTGALKPTVVTVQDVFSSKKEYNELRAQARQRSEHLEGLRNAYVFMRPTEEDIHRSTGNQLRIKELNMKLVTLNTRLMEADENKKNYELYIIRMKEEDVQLSKQIDHLRHLVVEYDRLLHKMDKMNGRVTSQRTEIEDEITRFQRDIAEFAIFAAEQLAKYRRLINRNITDTRMQQKNALERNTKMDEKKRKQLLRLQQEYDVKAGEATEIKEELEVWQEKVAFYEQRFHKITAATGLSRPEDIINKFFFNDEITADLKRDLSERQRQIELHRNKKQELTEKLDEMKMTFVQSKWRDVDSLQSKLYEKNLEMIRAKEGLERLMQKLAFVQEGIISLVNAVDADCAALKDDAYTKEEVEQHKASSETTFESCMWWMGYAEKRLGTVADDVHRGIQKQGYRQSLAGELVLPPPPSLNMANREDEDEQTKESESYEDEDFVPVPTASTPTDEFADSEPVKKPVAAAQAESIEDVHKEPVESPLDASLERMRR